MPKPSPLTYRHTQNAPWFLLLFTFAALFFTGVKRRGDDGRSPSYACLSATVQRVQTDAQS